MSNVAERLVRLAQTQPNQLAVVQPLGYQNGKRQYRTMTFQELNEDSDRIAYGLRQHGVEKGMRLALLIRPGIDFVSSVFGLLKSGAVMILIDPGMGRNHLLKCLEDADPEGFVAISPVQAVWRLLRKRFPKAHFSLTVGHRWFWGGPTLKSLRRMPYPGVFLADVSPDDPAAIIFTTGSTGPPKGVLYQHRTFNTQVEEISRQYGIAPGQIDLPGFPMFGLFNCAMGSTAVLPDMDASRPAAVNPENILEAVRDWKVSQSFGSPAIWKAVGEWCDARNETLPEIRMILSAGAPVPVPVLRTIKKIIHPEGEIHTPYGATEALPVATIAASEILSETAEKTSRGAGVCVGRKFPSIQWKVIRITDEPIGGWDAIEELPRGEIGELMVTGPQITREYVTHREVNAQAKVAEMLPDGTKRVWHRMGDVGYLDDEERFWFCGRKAHRVVTSGETLFTIPVEAIFNNHPAVARSALVGISRHGETIPLLIVELKKNIASTEKLRKELLEWGQTSPLTRSIEKLLFHPSFPVDIRHNAKIFREKLSLWANSMDDRQ